MSRIVSVVTPSFNQGEFIGRTIDSVLRQALARSWTLEYVVIDGGSRDATLDVLRGYSDRVRWCSEPDRGQADAVNKGLRSTSGEIVGWLNSDDVYYPGALQAVCEFFDQHPAVDVVYGEGDYLDAQDRVIGRYATEPFNLERLYETCFLCQPAVFFRRRLVDRFGVLDPRLHYALDYEYWLRAALGGAVFGRVSATLAGSRLYPGIKTFAGRLEGHAEVNSMMRARLGHVPDRWLYNYAHARLERTRIDRSRHLRFATGLALVTLGASLRWNRSISDGVRRSVLIWLKDGLKLTAADLRTRARAVVP